MSFQVGVDPAQLHQLGLVERAGFGPCRVQKRGRVPLRQHEPVVVGVLGVARIEAHVVEKQHRHNLGGRTATRGVAAARLGRRANRIDAQTRSDVVKRRQQRRDVVGHGHLRAEQSTIGGPGSKLPTAVLGSGGWSFILGFKGLPVPRVRRSPPSGRALDTPQSERTVPGWRDRGTRTSGSRLPGARGRTWLRSWW